MVPIVKTRTLTEALGWYGFTAILGSFALANFGILSISSETYQLLNLSGALALVADSWPDRNWQIITLNGIWAIVAGIALLR